MIIVTNSYDETENFGFELGSNAKKGQVYCLIGDLGVGKTVFSKGFAKGLGVIDEITSPTFSIVNEYDLKDTKFFHFDVYRVNGVEDMYDLGYEEYFFGDGICLIEWSNLIEEIIPEDSILISIKKDMEKGDNYRIIEVIK